MATFVKSPIPIRGPSILDIAWAGLRAADKKAAKAEEKPEAALPKDAPVRSEPYRRLVAARPCKNCGRQRHSQAAHVPPAGKAIKQDDRETFPLCADGPYGKGCHPKFDQFELMPRDKAVRQGRKWAAETRAEIEADGTWPKRLPKWKGKR
jgi:hypothetical protein